MNDINPTISFPSPAAAAYAEVIMALALPKTYTYSVPAHLMGKLQKGSRVEAGLGKNKRYAGIVKRIFSEKPAGFNPRDIYAVLDEEPLVNERQLQLWEWIADYYMCSEGEVMAAALPSNFKLSSETIVVYNEEYGENFSELEHDEYLVAEALLIKKELKLTEIQQILDVSHVYPVVKRLIEKKVCWVWESLKEKYKPKFDTYVVLNEIYRDEEKLEALLNDWGRAPKQLELLLGYLHLQKTDGEVTQSELLKKSGASAAQLKGLESKNILRLEKRRMDRLPQLAPQVNIDFELSPAQLVCFEKIKQHFAEKPVCLLQGVTSSGKTQIYIKLIEEFIKSGRQVLYLLPEIALTSQVIRRLQKHFGGYIAIYHSRFSSNERVEIWNKVRHNEVKVVIGARSSLFLPFHDLALVIADEEQDASYKQQEPAPRYNARDAAIYYASLFDANVLLGSATPSIETNFNAVSGKYAKVELNERFGGIELPEIKLIDTRKVVRKDRAKVMISPALQEAMEDSLIRKRQVILFQNRRGYSPYLICGVCGFIPHCTNCDVTLTYHKMMQRMQCHYCGTTYPKLITCPACGSSKWVERNFGTERIEEELREIFPKTRIARMDMDSVKGKTAHDALIQQFEQQSIDVLVGTQMVVKGLDFDHVSLVGVLDADGLLSFADFRVNERAFQLMEQVSGRAGRKKERGMVLIQTSNPEHPVLGFVQNHDFESLYQFELVGRKNFFYPPFSRLIQLVFRHKTKDDAESAANFMANTLKIEFGSYLVGPAEPVVSRVRNQYLYELLLKLPRDGSVIRHCKLVIQQQMAIMASDRKFRTVDIVPDVDPI